MRTVDPALIKSFMSEHLTTAAAMKEAADRIECSLATLYRYKRDPAQMPFGKLVELGKYLGFPIEATAAWSRADVLRGEQRRLELESAVAGVPGGTRFTVVPAFTVNSELEAVTRALFTLDYGSRGIELVDEYVSLRSKRHDLYHAAQYTSYEIFSGAGYLDFYRRRGRFRALSEELHREQLAALIASTDFPHVNRRIYCRATPELPIVTCYSNAIAVMRADDFTVEFNGPTVADQLRDIFSHFFEHAQFKSREEVKAFLHDPTPFAAEYFQ